MTKAEIKNKETLRSIILEDEIENISFNQDSFLINFGNITNTDRNGEQSILLETYVEIPYNFIPGNLRLHRGVVDVLECSQGTDYIYSGFVHYNGTILGKWYKKDLIR